ncbi:hypothetical protein EJ05DRAFT_541866 [Pseudovirgaria hyperparasitica]|uniref:Aminodeoxychorismate lyase n=1 Tax=Pseudovirgaria hyperparasitica TaxID=470096 RepID=A0A6A6VRL7_9PEZI|nr:uncharacterized protein EJ05DRAFT_541866 [Pseudovirgaria hyperparasitica]KAF2753328.1 hypothetical protein EJ05DRAFT_541866 [Pseudovirgaria hyperparasitica]
MSSPEGFELFTSLRYDSLLLQSDANNASTLSFTAPTSFYMLVYHRDRMLEAARHFDWLEVALKLEDGKGLEALLGHAVNENIQKTGNEGPFRVRVLFSKTASMKVECNSIPPVSLKTLYPQSIPAPQLSKPFKPSPLTGGVMTLGSDHQAELDQARWKLHVDKSSTPSTAYTSLKTTLRSHYDVARERSIPSNHSTEEIHEVLMYNDIEEMTEGSLTSVYFWRGGRWVTPPVGNTLLSVGYSGPEEGIGAQPECVKTGSDGDRLPSFRGRWGHSLRNTSKYPDSGGQRGTTRRWALRNGHCVEEVVEKNSVRAGDIVWLSNGVRGFVEGIVID